MNRRQWLNIKKKAEIFLIFIAMSGFHMLSCDGKQRNMEKSEQDQLSEVDILAGYPAFTAGFFPTHLGALALTFDDGPHPYITPQILQIIRDYNSVRSKEKQIRATFFVLGKNAELYPDLLEEIAADGHLLANHSYSHASLPSLYEAEAFYEVVQTDALISGINMQYGKDLSFLRAPYGAWGRCLAHHLNESQNTNKYIGPIFWHVGGAMEYGAVGENGIAPLTNAADWACPGAGLTAAECATGYRNKVSSLNGGIVLMHDINYYAPVILKNLLNTFQDYDFISLDEIQDVRQYVTLAQETSGC